MCAEKQTDQFDHPGYKNSWSGELKKRVCVCLRSVLLRVLLFYVLLLVLSAMLPLNGSVLPPSAPQLIKSPSYTERVSHRSWTWLWTCSSPKLWEWYFSREDGHCVLELWEERKRIEWIFINVLRTELVMSINFCPNQYSIVSCSFQIQYFLEFWS